MNALMAHFGMLDGEPFVRCPVAALVNGACTGCRYCERLWEAREEAMGLWLRC